MPFDAAQPPTQHVTNAMRWRPVVMALPIAVAMYGALAWVGYLIWQSVP